MITAWLFDKTVGWVLKAAVIATVLASLYGAMYGLISWVSAPRVKAAEAKINAKWEGQFKQQASDLKTLGKQFVDQRLEFEARTKAVNDATKQKIKELEDESIHKTALYQSERKVKQQITAERDAAIAGAGDLAKRLSVIKPIDAGDGSRADAERASNYANGLAIILAQCQQTARGILKTATESVDRLGEAEDGLRALKN